MSHRDERDERSRHRKAKIPIGSISAGGVDMARGHTSNITPAVEYDRRVSAPPKVVLNAETDPRKVPTHRGTHRGRDMREGAPRDAMLPDDPVMVAFPRKMSSRPPPMDDDPPIVDAPRPSQEDLSERPTVVMARRSRWVYLGAAVALMVLVAGVTKRLWTRGAAPAIDAPAAAPSAPATSMVTELAATVAPPEPAPAASPTVAGSAQPPSPHNPSSPSPSPSATASAKPTSPPAVAPAAAPSPKATFVPPFQLPEERKPR